MPYTTSGTTDTWTYWNQNYTSGTTSSATSTVWYRWIITSGNSGTSSYTVVNNQIWTHWNDRLETPARPYVPPRPALIRSAAEQADIDRRMAEMARVNAENNEHHRRRTEAAKERAKMLLLEHLTPEQQKTFIDHGWFMVKGGKTGKTYRIKALDHLVANVDLIENGKVVTRLCAHAASHECPLGDHLLYQKLMIELAEDEFIRIANLHAPLSGQNDNTPLHPTVTKKQLFPDIFRAANAA